MFGSETIIVPSLFFMIGFVVWVAITGWIRQQPRGTEARSRDGSGHHG